MMKDDGSLTAESTQQQSGLQPAERLFTSPFEWLRYYYSSILGVVGFFSYALGMGDFNIPALIFGYVAAMIAGPALGFCQTVYGLVQYFRKGEARYLHHLYSFLVALLFAGILFYMISNGYIPTA